MTTSSLKELEALFEDLRQRLKIGQGILKPDDIQALRGRGAKHVDRWVDEALSREDLGQAKDRLREAERLLASLNNDEGKSGAPELAALRKRLEERRKLLDDPADFVRDAVDQAVNRTAKEIFEGTASSMLTQAGHVDKPSAETPPDVDKIGQISDRIDELQAAIGISQDGEGESRPLAVQLREISQTILERKTQFEGQEAGFDEQKGLLQKQLGRFGRQLWAMIIMVVALAVLLQLSAGWVSNGIQIAQSRGTPVPTLDPQQIAVAVVTELAKNPAPTIDLPAMAATVVALLPTPLKAPFSPATEVPTITPLPLSTATQPPITIEILDTFAPAVIFTYALVEPDRPLATIRITPAETSAPERLRLHLRPQDTQEPLAEASKWFELRPAGQEGVWAVWPRLANGQPPSIPAGIRQEIAYELEVDDDSGQPTLLLSLWLLPGYQVRIIVNTGFRELDPEGKCMQSATEGQTNGNYDVSILGLITSYITSNNQTAPITGMLVRVPPPGKPDQLLRCLPLSLVAIDEEELKEAIRNNTVPQGTGTEEVVLPNFDQIAPPQD